MTPDDLALARRVGAIVPARDGARCLHRAARRVDGAWRYDGASHLDRGYIQMLLWVPDLDDPATCGVLQAWLMAHYAPIADMLAKHPGTYWQSVGWILDSEGERSTTLGVALARAIIATQEQKL